MTIATGEKTDQVLANRESRRLSGVQRSWNAAHQLHEKSKHPLSNPIRARKYLSENKDIKKSINLGKQISPTMLRSYGMWLHQHKQAAEVTAKHHRLTIANGKLPATKNVKLLYQVKQFMDSHGISIEHMLGIINVLKHLTE